MARGDFGGDLSAWVYQRNDTQLTNLVQFAPGITVTFWDAATDGSQHTDLLLSGSPVTSITSSSGGDGRERGALPPFQGPDDVLVMWAQAGDATARYLLLSWSVADLLQTARGDIADLTAALEAKADAADLATLEGAVTDLDGELTEGLDSKMSLEGVAASAGAVFWGTWESGDAPTPPGDGRIHWGFQLDEDE